MDREAAQLMGVDINHDHRHDLLHWRGAGRRGGRGPGPQYLGMTVFNIGFRAGLLGLHRGRAGRHRQHDRRRAGRLRDRLPRR